VDDGVNIKCQKGLDPLSRGDLNPVLEFATALLFKLNFCSGFF
jgi:hypothetical protein